MFYPNILLLAVVFSICTLLQLVSLLELKSYISDHGLHGTISFISYGNEIQIITDLSSTLEFEKQIWSWSINELPVDYTNLDHNRCDNLGEKLINLDNLWGYLFIPENNTVQLNTDQLSIDGDKGLYGKSLLLYELDRKVTICASIIMIEKNIEKIAIVRFFTPIAGNIYFRWFSTKDHQKDMVIISDLYHTIVEKDNDIDFTKHSWKIYVTDILDHNDRSEDNCNILQQIFNPENEKSNHTIGDIDHRLGHIKISTNYNKIQTKTFYRDDKLILLPNDINGPHRRLYVVIFEEKHPDTFLACAKIRYDTSTNAKVIIQSGGIKGNITLSQNSIFEPTFLNFNLTTSRGDLETKLVYSSSVSGYKIHELPIKTTNAVEKNTCLTSRFVFNPLKIQNSPPNGYGTQNQYPVGDLSGKLKGRNKELILISEGEELFGSYWDTYLPLQGKNSVLHRTLVIYKNTQYPSSEILSEPWICGSINLYESNFLYQKPVYTAQVLFRYPLVGRILFRQAKDEPWTNTFIQIDYLVHADGSNLNNTNNHRWAIHEKEPGKDFYNWTKRCLSSGEIFNPYKIDYNSSDLNTLQCNENALRLCKVGDLSTRLGTINIAGKFTDSDHISRKMIIDNFLPLSGSSSILGKSLVLYDDFGPKARGDRLACSKIGSIYRRKAVVKDWYSNGDKLSVKGKIEIIQQNENDVTNIEVDLQGLEDTSGYHVHMVSVEENLQFPCESLYGHWNPLNVDPSSSPKSYHGTSDQYEMGDLSGKFGTLDNYTWYKTSYNDTMLPLFGPRSILGRSIVIHKREQNKRWACSTIERGYSPSEASELRGIASFHHPAGYAFGYMKMRQLVYNDGSMSDTTIEISLRHPGKNDRNITRNHNWSIYVNPVGVDAAVKTQNTRCVAGGYVWNPYYTQLADPLNDELYRQECGPDNPLRCYVGDLSSRLGPIDIGLQKKILSDTNFPLKDALGRSIVIYSPNQKPERFACANIEPDYDIIKYVNIEKSPQFVVEQFIDDVQQVMGIPDWFLTVDNRKTKNLHSNACVQLLVHFKGPIAGQIEQDFNRLLIIGQLEGPSLYIPGYINTKRKSKISYKLCGVVNKNMSTTNKKINLLLFNLILFIFIFIN